MQQTITLRTFDDKSQLNDVILEILHRMYVRLHGIILVRLTRVSVILSLWRETDTGVIESVVCYVDPKSPGSLGFLGGKERVRLPLHEEHCSLKALKKHIVAHAALKTKAEKRGLGPPIELKLCRLAKTKEAKDTLTMIGGLSRTS